jgi:cardiolipin synthase
MRDLANAITLVRLGLVPVMAYLLIRETYSVALWIFLVSALSDLADGYLARRLGTVSKLGATLDPIADKLNMVVATVILAWDALMPLWLAIAIVVRDFLIVTGALAYRLAYGHLEVAPTLLSKTNTFLEFALLLLVMAVGAGYLASGVWTPMAFYLVFATVVASAVHYAWLVTRNALTENRRR